MYSDQCIHGGLLLIDTRKTQNVNIKLTKVTILFFDARIVVTIKSFFRVKTFKFPKRNIIPTYVHIYLMYKIYSMSFFFSVTVLHTFFLIKYLTQFSVTFFFLRKAFPVGNNFNLCGKTQLLLTPARAFRRRV